MSDIHIVPLLTDFFYRCGKAIISSYDLQIHYSLLLKSKEMNMVKGETFQVSLLSLTGGAEKGMSRTMARINVRLARLSTMTQSHPISNHYEDFG